MGMGARVTTHTHTCLHTTVISSLEIYKQFQEEAYSIALHPSGLFVLVGFSEKLRLLNILIDDIRVFKEIAIRGCREVPTPQNVV